MTYRTLLFELRGPVARITLNRPEKRNALDASILAELKIAMDAAESDHQSRVIVLRGAGPDFCAGVDLAALQKIAQMSVLENLEDAKSFMELFVFMRKMQKPVIAAVHGRALAGGCGLATACDLVLATRTAKFAYTEVKIGFVPAIVLTLARRAVTEKKLFELLTRGDLISADEAAQIGLVNQVYEETEFESRVDEYVNQFLEVSASAVALTKSLLYQTDGMPWEQAMRAGVDVNTLARLTEDCKQGIAKFLQKKS